MHAAQAQQDAGYAPPPMFEDMTPPMVRPEGQDGYLVTPKASTNTPLPQPTLDRAPVVVPRVSVDPDAARPAPTPVPVPPPSPTPTPVPTYVPVAPAAPKAPVAPVPPPAAPVAPVAPPKMKPIVEETYIKRDAPVKKPAPAKKTSEEPRTEAVKKPEPTPSPSKPVTPTAPAKVIGDAKAPPPPSAEAPVIEPVKRDPHVSVIQGPKTMPALPTGNVEQQVTFEAAPETPETIMERHRKEAQAKRAGEPTLTPIVPAPNPNVQPAEFDRGGQDVLKKIIPFQPGQISIPPADADPIVAGVVKELDREGMKDWRVQIKAYATPHGTGLSSDRRIALSRALSLRSTMITQGVPAGKIDVLAEGLQSEGAAPPDRIDLYLYGPKGK